jgi:hypothetical protein
MLHRLILPLVAGLVVVSSLAAPATANMITFTTAASADAGGGPVDAKVTFTTSANQIVVVLENLQPDVGNVGQCISGLWFTLDPQLTAGSLTSSSGVSRTVASDGTYSDDGTVSTQWLFDITGSEWHLSALGAGQPKRTILGPPDGSDEYGGANSSIAGNKPHNPFLAGSATFTLSAPGVTDQTDISGVIFGFGTAGNQNLTVPEPATMALLVAGGALTVLRRRRA